MDTTATRNRIHPLMATAAVSLTLVSLVGAAAIAGLLPNSRGAGYQAPEAVLAAPTPAPVPAPLTQAAAAPAAKPVVIYRTVVRHDVPRHRADTYNDAQLTQAARDDAPYRQVSAHPQNPQPVQQAQNSPLGIGIGALVGGLVGSKVGGGNGRTLAAIAGAVGGGYLGNEIAKGRFNQPDGQQR